MSGTAGDGGLDGGGGRFRADGAPDVFGRRLGGDVRGILGVSQLRHPNRGGGDTCEQGRDPHRSSRSRLSACGAHVVLLSSLSDRKVDRLSVSARRGIRHP
jgi:hypothetical protein